jgi:hypothetical protein
MFELPKAFAVATTWTYRVELPESVTLGPEDCVRTPLETFTSVVSGEHRETVKLVSLLIDDVLYAMMLTEYDEDAVLLMAMT